MFLVFDNYISAQIYIIPLHATPLVQYHLLAPEYSNSKCVKNPIKKVATLYFVDDPGK